MNTYIKINSNSHLISFGNTGARLGDPRTTYFSTLNALTEFRIQNKNWEVDDQKVFGKILGKYQVFDIKTDNVVSSDKDVRLKTAFLSDLGFTTNSRFVTNVGSELIENSKATEINEFEISKDSYSYFKQFLKYQQDDFQVLPLLSLIYSCIEFKNELPVDFVTYIWSGSQTKEEVNQNIKVYKRNLNYKETLYQSVVDSRNSEIAEENVKNFFVTNNINDNEELKELLYVILPHGKGDSFKDKTISLFNDIYKYWINKSNWATSEKREFIHNKLKSRYKDISSKKPSDYLEALFNTTSLNNSSDWKKIILFFERTPLIASIDEGEFILNFHKFYMFIKKLSICEEYRDLNIRHLKNSKQKLKQL